MSLQQAAGWTQRCFLGGLTVAGAAGLLSLPARPVAAEPPPETTRLRLHKSPGICITPRSTWPKSSCTSRGLPRWTTSRLTPPQNGSSMYQQLAAGAIDFNMAFVPPFILQVDAGAPPVPQALRARKIGRAVVSSAVDRPRMCTTSTSTAAPKAR
jgi:NitT/TauT family transport system substrate-binding protein